MIKRFITFTILASMMLIQGVLAASNQEVFNTYDYDKYTAQYDAYVQPPKWEDYVPEKYQNPRTDFTMGKSIAELSVGVVLTDLIITAPIGIPMICHSTTKLKHQSYAKKKVKFENGLKDAEKITNPQEKREFYDKLIKDLKLKKRTA